MVDFIALCIYDKTLLIVTYLGCAYTVTRLTFVHVLLFKFPGKHAHHTLIGAIWIVSNPVSCLISMDCGNGDGS